MSIHYSKYHKSRRSGTRRPIAAALKIVTLLSLSALPVLSVIYGKNIFDQPEPVTIVKAFKPDAAGGKAECPACRQKFSYNDFKRANIPNMRSCPQCDKAVPEQYLLRRCFNSVISYK